MGVGAMELFGNKLIGGAVEGQYGLKDDDDLIKSQLAVAYKDNDPKFKEYYTKLIELCEACNDDVWGKVSEILPEFLGEDIEITDEWAKKNGDTLTVTIGK